ncbi:MAG: hypothetical protein A2068_12900 [Ignavibacteria bacterium GWB2_35_6b]|nr:MAG: hypothetical protein A2068_12900 [Ignavibacteria bacterium GWB2_35_6b]
MEEDVVNVLSDADLLKQQIEELKKEKITLSRILKACFVDHNNNINKKITPLIFFSKLLVNSNKWDEYINRLYSYLHYDKKIIFLSGFGGIGKTTFINLFAKFNQIDISKNVGEFNFHIIDFHKSAGDDLDGEKKILNQIKFYIKKIYYDNNLLGEESFLFFIRNINTMKRFFTSKLIEYCERSTSQPGNSSSTLKEFVDNIESIDDVFLYLLYIYIYEIEQKDVQHKQIFILDNLDKVEIAYNSNWLVNILSLCIDKATELSQQEIFKKPIDVVDKFKFIFCLRDVNYSDINNHLYGSIPHNHIVYFRFNLQFEFELYKIITKKRLAFYKEIKGITEVTEINNSEILFIERILDDQFFQNVFVPLFNYNYKKITSILDLFISTYKENNSIMYLNEYGLRGYLLYEIIRNLKDKNFLTKYYSTETIQAEGHCSIPRMLLTYILNLSIDIRNIKSFEVENDYHISLYDIASSFYKIYDAKKVFQCLCDMFLLYKDNWVHLISIKNASIKSINSLDDEADLFERLQKTNLDNEAKEKIKLALCDIKVKINPSGYVYIKHIKNHFEFYNDIVGGGNSLFHDATRETEDQIYKTMKIINKVCKLTSIHITNMKIFYGVKFEGILKMNYYDFIKGDYSFKHTGSFSLIDSDDSYSVYPSKVPQGIFFGLRIITSHMNYIDTYRLFINKRIKSISINKELINYINKLLMLIKNNYSNLGGDKLYEMFLKKIEIIKDSGYEDFTTAIT